MNVFVDTSALYAVLDADDDNHSAASAEWQRLLLDSSRLVTTNYVLVEATALMQHRLGIEAVRLFEQDVCPVLGLEWIDEPRHAVGMASVLAAGRRKLSLVDCVSFAAMRDLGLRDVFAFDEHFAEQGFTCLPFPSEE
jgi:predicted nucleic acid-binding protein